MRHPWTVEEQKRVDEALGVMADPRKRESAIDVNRKGVPRGYIRPGKAFEGLLSEYQKTQKGGRVRVSRANTRMWRMAKQADMTIEEWVEGLSNEELVRGQPKNKNGGFSGRPPNWVPRAFHRACVAELMRRGKKLWQENYLQAIETMTKIANGEVKGASAGDRLKAAQYVIERLEGKIPEKLVITDDQPWMLVIDDIVADVSDTQVQRAQKALSSAQAVRQEIADPRDPIIDAEIMEEPKPKPAPRRRRSPVRRTT